ncbi:uncharacterized protein DUF4190 [Mycolicibacterium mucogenicum 261Sha1.1M5]|uniref:DUF4190 domain-containing protein n=1 Tax=Leucobacter aridicollis TaxID=283878 RepID=A0A852QSW4_9MICO|nr:DUF4190 domain-containing protein [Leucobacter aridicollis]MBL3683410.1 DUF4190 domain-containing protein [Leucobacter aridicollis]MCS3428785.1 hypothetical protein [Leucobacter aridicollis]NYD25283.1 hypothetical protein [Leucobacter aridicollis]RKQ89952.1 uncharacterized protein DUF4190 [Mycolicibacterium mucogenicum 261Sha1.1M5]
MSYTPPPRVVYQPPAQPPVPPPANGMAVTSLVLGIIGGLIGVWAPFPIFGIIAGAVAFLPALLAIIFGHAGLRTAKRTGTGRGPAITGLVLGYATLAIIIAATLFWGSVIAFGTDAGMSSSF